MSIEFAGGNIVVLANEFNPSIVSQLWLVQHNVIAADNFLPNCVFTPVFSQVATKQFDLLVLDQRAQITPKEHTDDAASLAGETLRKIVELLPETPYRAIGINWSYSFRPSNGEMRDFSRRLFFNPASEVCRAFDVPDGQFGVYCSREWSGGRLRLEARPQVAHEGATEPDNISFKFNFHKDLAGDSRVPELLQMLLMAAESRRIAFELATSFAHQQ